MNFRQLHTRPIPSTHPGKWRPLALVAVALLALFSGRELRGQNDAAAAIDDKLLIVPVDGLIDSKKSSSTISKVKSWLEREPTINWVIFEISSSGGSHDAAIELGDYIFSELRNKTTVAFIPDGAEATGVAVIPALACREIAMGPKSRLGAGAAEPGSVEEREKARMAVELYSERRKRSQLLAGLTVMPARETVYSLRRRVANPAGRYVFWYQADLNNSDPVERKSEYHTAEKILGRDELLTLDQAKAFEYDWVRYRGIESGDDRYKSLLLEMNVVLPEESVFVVGRGAIKKKNLSGQGLVDFLNHPLTRFFLVLGIILGITIELKMLGTMVPGAIAILCFTLLVSGGFFPESGSLEPTTTWFEVALFLVGLGLIGLELGLMPGIAIFAIAGALLCFGSLIMIMVPSTAIPGGEQLNLKEAFLLISSGLGAAAALFFAILRFLPASVSDGIVSKSSITGVPDADTAEDSRREKALLLGKAGICESPLRPAGIISLEDGQRLDVVADGEFIEKGERVVIREYTSTRIVVSRVEETG